MLEGCIVEQFIRFLMHHHTAPTNLIICSTREVFLQDFMSQFLTPNPGSVSIPTAGQSLADSDVLSVQRIETTEPITLDILLPTLSTLAASRTVKMSFCPDLTHLLALLSVLPHQSDTPPPPSGTSHHGVTHRVTRPILAILNPIRLHKSTSAFSAQGFNRTFASAVETAYHLGRQLVLVETPEPGVDSTNDEDVMDHERAVDDDDADHAHVEQLGSPWDQPLSMLNVTTKTFGVGERGWVGRTVSVRQVAGRWCRFASMTDYVSNAQEPAPNGL